MVKMYWKTIPASVTDSRPNSQVRPSNGNRTIQAFTARLQKDDLLIPFKYKHVSLILFDTYSLLIHLMRTV